jgi:hypothetical protein
MAHENAHFFCGVVHPVCSLLAFGAARPGVGALGLAAQSPPSPGWRFCSRHVCADTNPPISARTIVRI